MKIKVDRWGRVRLPTKVLESFELAPGVFLEIDMEGNAVRLRPAAEKPLLAERSGVLVFEGVALEKMSKAVRKLREARNCRMGGMQRPSRPK